EWLGLSLANDQSPARQSPSVRAGVSRSMPTGPIAIPRVPTVGLLQGRGNLETRGRHRGGRGFVPARRQFLTHTPQPDSVATDMGKEVPGADPSAVPQQMILGSLKPPHPASDPALELLRELSSPAIADLAKVDVCLVPEG